MASPFGGGGSGGFLFGNQQQQPSTFGSGSGAFGSNNNNTTSAFGQSTSTPFGGNNTNPSGGLFGSTSNNTSTGFGGLGNNSGNTTSLFGASKPATTGFGSTSNNSGSLFGSTANNTTNSGFGSSSAFGSNNNTASSAFGSGTTSSGGFGGFGNTNSNTTSTPFGSTQQKTLFGSAGTSTAGGFGTSSPFGGGTALNKDVPPPQGTNVVPFQPYTEKETNGMTCNYETITFMEPYAKYSLEELRLADYNGGRQFGNATGGVGAFGQANFGGSSFTGNAGGFGSNTGGSLFGNNNTTTASTGFGGTATAGGFGATSGGLFGNNNNQNKPGGLFGQASTGTTTGGLFGTANNSTNNTSTFGGFGSANNTNTAAGSSLFGSNNQTQNKPGGLFGSTNNTASNAGGFSFGATNNNQSNTGGGLFGNNNNTPNTGGGLFGNNNNQQQQTQQAGSGTSLFGNNQSQTSGGLFGSKPATTGFGTTATQGQSGGLFGNNNASNNGGGLFGTNTTNQNNTGGGLFGNNNTTANNTGGGLFGAQNQPKPGGLFATNTTNNTGGGLFGNTNTANNTGGGLFGNNANNTQQQSGGLFGNTAANNTGGGLFGNSQNNQNKGLFGGTTTANTQGSSLFGGSTNSGGLFGQSQSNQQQNPNQQEVKHASLLDPNPYGQSSIWTSLPQPTAENSKPLFTPLTATKKMQESAMKPLPSLRLNQSRYNTPPRRNGYGFSYSTYGTPSSVTSTPGGANFSGSMYGGRGFSGGSFGRSFNRSASVQNLRSQYASDSDDVWKPNAFAPSHRNSGGSIKRLTIDRSIRQDLFNRPQVPALPAPKPAGNADGSGSSVTMSDGTSEAPRKLNKRVSFENPVQETTLNSASGALVRTESDSDSETTPPRNTNGPTEATRNGDLQAVPEDRESHQVSSKSAKANPQPDQEPGAYWMKPTRQEIAKMPREQKRAYKGFQVGRYGCGFITFDGTVDLEALNLDDVFGNIVVLSTRSATVYPDPSTKPLVGRGLNVPSTIEIENSWPRSKGKLISDTTGRHFDQHIKRLSKMEGTEFINYDSAQGVWKFKVPHYTTYGLDYEDDDGVDQSELSLPPTSLENHTDASVMEVDDHTDSVDGDDTFAFKRSLPGQFSKHSIVDEDTELASDEVEDAPEYEDDGSDRSMVSDEDMISDEERSPTMPGSLPEPPMPFSSPIRKPTAPTIPGTPGRPLLDLEGDWAEQLQRTISPRKQNRDMLREAQSKVLLDKNFSPLKPKAAAPQVNFKSSIDIMNSLFLPTGTKKSNKATEPDFEFPYSKRSKQFHPNDQELSQTDRAWHQSFKPHFTNSGKMIYKTAKRSDSAWSQTPLARDGKSMLVVGQNKNDKVYNLATALSTCEVKTVAGLVPEVAHKKLPFSQLASRLTNAPQSVLDTYQLAHVLFDDYEDEFTHGLNKPLQKTFRDRIRRDRLVQFLAQHISQQLSGEVAAAEQSDSTRAAILRLVAYDVEGACRLLKTQKNYRLMLIVSELKNADQSFKQNARRQIDAWNTQKSLSEFNPDIWTLWEFCAGNTTRCKGTGVVPVEDRVEGFDIGQRYGLNWLQSFALGLFYGTSESQHQMGPTTIQDTVLAFYHRCTRGDESQKPADGDAMWALLQYYASTFVQNEDDADTVPHPSFPECLDSLAQPWNHAELFDFYQAMQANSTFVRALLKYDDVAKVDQLAGDFASELSTRGDIASAIYALIHVGDVETREILIRDLLDRFAASLPGPDTATTDAGIELWTRLTMDLKVPQSWLYMAKARYAASATNNGGDNVSELRYLVAAEAWELAHDCLLKRVAPSYTIDEDWNGLLEMCRLFGDDPAGKVPGWYDGGAIYQTFANLMTGAIAKEDSQVISGLRKKLVTLGSSNAKARVQLNQLSNHEREEHIAIKEMANGLAHLAVQGGNVGTLKEISEMPITQDVRAEIGMALAGRDDKPAGETSSSSTTKAAGKSRGVDRSSRRRRAAEKDTEAGEAGDVDNDGDELMA